MSPEHPLIHVTVAAVVQDAVNRFLMVEERIDGRLVLNQPAGHLEADESLTAAVVRETLEETGWEFIPQGLVGVYRWVSPAGDVYLRTAFFGSPGRRVRDTLEEGIVAVRWIGTPALRAAADRHRSPLVWRCVADFLEGRRYPLALLTDLTSD